MGENSSGANRSRAAKEKIIEQFSQKTRSFSLGDQKQEISIDEINKIILGSGNINSNQQRNTDKDNNPKEAKNSKPIIPAKEVRIDKIQGDLKKNEGDSNEYYWQEEVFQDTEVAFQPRRTVQRTPPPKNDNIEKMNNTREEVTGKRQRAETSPGNENEKKRPCEGRRCHNADEKSTNENVSSSNKVTETEKKENQKNIDIENLLLEIFTSLETIQQITNQENQVVLRDATFLIQKNLALVTCKVGQLQQEKMALEHKIQMGCQAPGEQISMVFREEQFKRMPYLRTYANVAQKPAAEPSKENETKTWTTPKTLKKLETVISMENISDPKETMRQFKRQMANSDLEGGVKNIKHLKSGAIVVESFNEAQQKKIKETLGNKENIKIKETSNVKPMFLITGILKGYSNADFIEELIRLNSEIEVEFPNIDIYKAIKVIAKRNCRNPTKENWILEAPPCIAKWFLKKETVVFDLMKVYVQEHFNLAICFNCAGFGHVAKYCKELQCCHKCSANNHTGNECTAADLKCPNCCKMKYKEEDSKHSARDTNCPIYQKRIINYKNQVNYSDSFLR